MIHYNIEMYCKLTHSGADNSFKTSLVLYFNEKFPNTSSDAEIKYRYFK